MKHIESIQPEYAAGDLSRLLVSEPDATASAALTALLHNVTGCAIPPTADLPESEVEELVPLCLSILRRHWTTPLTALGDGTTPMSLADLLRRLIGDRVHGNEAWSIPAIHADIPTAVAALRDRKIGGVPEAADGMSLVHLLTNPSAVTELTDDNEWSTETYFPATIFPNLAKVTANIKEWYSDSLSTAKGFIKDSSSITEVVLPSLKKIDGTGGSYGVGNNLYFLANLNGLEKVTFSELEYCRLAILVSGNNVKEIVADKLVNIATNVGNAFAVNFVNCPKLRKLVLGKVKSISINGRALNNCTDLIHLEFGAGVDINLTLAGSINSINWSPTNALDASRTDLIEEGSTAANNLEQFLSNFKTYIAQRLKGGYAVGTGSTLTLSQAVRDAIQQDPDIVNIITSKGWTISPAPSV